MKTKMNKDFIKLYDDEGRIYIVNINDISIIDVDGLGILFEYNVRAVRAV